MEKSQNNENNWWDPRVKGTLLNFAAKTAILGIMLGIVGEHLIDHSRGAVEPVISSNTELIRQDLQQPVEEMRQSARDALEKLEGMENDVNELKEFISKQFGVKFEQN